jgi:aspartyl/asparaginyl beta-hydroxylase (cupin superfamily)
MASQPGFLDPGAFPFTEPLESHFPAIRDELLAVLPLRSWSRYIDHDPQRGRALLFLLYVKGRPNRRNCGLCPRTAAVLAKIPQIRQAVFGFLPPGARIAPHRGSPGILRVHLGLLAEAGAAGWRAEGETRPCVEGKVTIFEDGSLHEAWNAGNTPRVTLICDPPAPNPEGNEMQRALESDERRYGLGYLMRTYGRGKSPTHPFNRFLLPHAPSLEAWALRLEPWLLPIVLFHYNHFSARHAAIPSAQ